MIQLSVESIIYQRLVPIARQLNKLDCDYCNTGKIDDLKVETLLDEATKLLEPVGYKAFHQSDPRGCSLYIIDDTMNDTNYTNGMAVIAEPEVVEYNPSEWTIPEGHKCVPLGATIIPGDKFFNSILKIWQATSRIGSVVGSPGMQITYIRKITQ
jgi:hypothetical protein